VHDYLQGVLASGDGGAVMGKDIKLLAIENSSFEGNAVSDSVRPAVQTSCHKNSRGAALEQQQNARVGCGPAVLCTTAPTAYSPLRLTLVVPAG
jgi:hypothetical protein